jgi:hypothetical protein
LKILLDENVDVEILDLFPGHEIRHATERGLRGLTNGAFFRFLDLERYELFVAADKNVRHQQNMKSRGFALVVLDVHPKNFANLAACIPELHRIMGTLSAGEVRVIEGPHLKRSG